MFSSLHEYTEEDCVRLIPVNLKLRKIRVMMLPLTLREAGFPKVGGCDMEEVSSALLGIQQRISTKLVAAGATSREKAATIQEADFNVQEQNWLNYIAGGLFAVVKKTKDERYYVTT